MDSDLRHFSGSVCSAEPGPDLQSTKWVCSVLRSTATLKLQAASASTASRSQIHFVLDCEFNVVIALSETLSCCQIPHVPPFSCKRSHHTCLRSWLESILASLLTYILAGTMRSFSVCFADTQTVWTALGTSPTLLQLYYMCVSLLDSKP